MNNARTIVKGYIEKYNRTGVAYFARMVYEMTSFYPDGLENMGIDTSEKSTVDELDFINEPIH